MAAFLARVALSTTLAVLTGRFIAQPFSEACLRQAAVWWHALWAPLSPAGAATVNPYAVLYQGTIGASAALTAAVLVAGACAIVTAAPFRNPPLAWEK